MSEAGVAQALSVVQRSIADAMKAAGRTDMVDLVAVTKTFEAAHVRPALEAGQRIVGENRVQEAKGKWPALREAFPDIELHLLGPLQSNKAKDAVALFDVIESVDREKIAEAIAKAADAVGRMPRCLIQVNIGREPQKAGAAPEDAAALVERARALGLPVIGLMAIPPADEPPGPHFAALKTIADGLGLPTSMGMSGDYREAIAHGARWVRVGSAIFGARPPIAAG
ncbi:YggS family pyridoxal phosphate-dependent enzyme [Acuticoccus sp. I52.16.1]|uniref:YggS family pyridoxal phosphate-dependent enzyme n=1 Tax=Acuticoccus sp. I52.16.1 TaxID=2928472 RepID=UPI002112DBCF|nr:YggS family pyridoxal phosphate-dependent enzyme [Acuticoccus sp. I52.16.1]